MARQVVMFCHESEREDWNLFVTNSSQGHLMQTWEWGSFKMADGWNVQRVGIEFGGKIVAGAQMLLRPLPWLLATVAYIPKGPVVDLTDQETMALLLSAIHQIARSHRAIFLKIEPNFLNDSTTHALLRHYDFQPSIHANQPRSTLIIDLSGGEEVVLANMRSKTRKLIRRAGREGVEIVEGGNKDLDVFYNILDTTTEIKNFSIHDQSFYEKAWYTFQKVGKVKLLFARYQGQTVAGKMIFIHGDRSLHFWGGTTYEGRDSYASYLIQWEAIKWAIAQKCRYTDLWGIPDEIADLMSNGHEIPKDQQGGLWGVYNFKRGFGGEIESYVGAYDYVYWSLPYWFGTNLMRGRSVDLISKWLEKISR